MLDGLFSSILGPDEVLRIDRLEVDLGRLKAPGLEAQFVEELQQRIEEELLTRLHGGAEESRDGGRTTRRTTPEASRLETFITFLKTGTLPWWRADASSFDPAAELRALAAEQPGELRQAIRQAGDTVIIRRLVRQCPSPALEVFIETSFPERARDILDLRKVWTTALSERSGRSVTSERVEVWIWEVMLVELLTDGAAETGGALLESLVTTLLKRSVEETGASAEDVLDDVARRAKEAPEEYAVIAKKINQTQGNDADSEPIPDRLQRGDARARGEKPLEIEPNRSRASHGSPGEREQEPPDREQGGERDSEEEHISDSSPQTSRSSRAERKKQSVPSDEIEEARRMDPARAGEAASTVGIAETAAEAGDAVGRAGSETTAFASDYHVDNAGLVLLWPYLGRFFTALDLLEDSAFVDEEAQARAVGLTQYLVTGETGEAEHQLLLNKLLCGWPFEEPLQKLEGLTDSERAECETLITSVIDNWKALKNTSVEGFRTSFLLREGCLARQELNWLLKVDRKGYDVLLERLPWGIGLIKQPWMDQPLSVEW